MTEPTRYQSWAFDGDDWEPSERECLASLAPTAENRSQS